jgi:hypothetical protein
MATEDRSDSVRAVGGDPVGGNGGVVVMAVVASIVNGKWVPVDDGRSHEIDTPSSDIDRIAAHLGQAVRLAQQLSPTDARRARDLMHAAQGMLNASTYLPADDQKLFEKSLRCGDCDDAA